MIFEIIIISFLNGLALNKVASSNICSSLACEQAAYSILENIDQSVDSCENFYEFVCGNFPNNKTVPIFYWQLRNRVQKQLWSNNENEITENNQLLVKPFKSYYNVCMDEEFTNDRSTTVCFTPTCQEAAILLQTNMDESISPCNNLYEFACGNFIENAIISDDQVMKDFGYNHEFQRILKQLKTSIEEEIKEDDPRSFKLLKAFYEICMDEDQIEKNSENELLEILNKLGGWPILVGNSWDDTYFDWKEMVYKCRETGYRCNYFIKFTIEPDAKNTSRYRIYLEPPVLGIPQIYLDSEWESDILTSYFKYMVDFAEVLGADSEQAKKELRESLDFEIQLAEISWLTKVNSEVNDYYNPITVEDLQAQYPGIPYLDYLNHLASPYFNISLNEVVIVSNPDYFRNLTVLLSRTPKRVLANYALWRLVDNMSEVLGKRVQQIQQEFYSAQYGKTTKSHRWMSCLDKMETLFSPALGALYVRRHFDETNKISASRIVWNIRKSFEKILARVYWMDKKTRSQALEKLEQMRQLVGNPDEFLNDEKLDSYYRSLKLDQKSFLQSIVNFRLFNRGRSYEQFRKPIDKGNWVQFSSATVNAFYCVAENNIYFPAGILNGIFFNKNRPKYMNYGGIGPIIGHEMTHSFDDTGRHFDKDGNMVDWWDNKTTEKYLRRIKCMVDQYFDYNVYEVGLPVHGLRTLDENIADNCGIKVAYFAYEEWEKQNGVEPLLPGMEKFTPKQIFWITNANTWCSTFRPESLKHLLFTDPHSPNEYRVIGTAANMPEFARDFNCPVGSPMNPVKKCTVW